MLVLARFDQTVGVTDDNRVETLLLDAVGCVFCVALVNEALHLREGLDAGSVQGD